MNRRHYVAAIAENSKVDNATKMYYLDRYQRNPEEFQMPQLPALWYLHNFDVHDFPTGLDHALFLGVLKSLCTCTLRLFLVNEKSLDFFCTKLNGKLDKLKKTVSPILNIEQNSGHQLAFSGWLCRNWVTFARCAKWLLSHLLHSVRDTCDDKNKIKRYNQHLHYSNYTKQDIRDWCNDRNICFDGVQGYQMSALREWFITVTQSPELLFKDYGRGDILEYVEDNFPDDVDTYLELADDDMRNKFTPSCSVDGLKL